MFNPADENKSFSFSVPSKSSMPTTSINFSLPTSSHVKIIIYDQWGKIIIILLDEFKEAGSHNVTWSANMVSSGMYYVKMTTNDFEQMQKLILIK